MASVDGQIREALRAHLAACLAVPGPDDDASSYRAPPVLTYQSGAFRPEDMPLVHVDLGGWNQHRIESSNAPGTRAWARTYDVEVAVVDSTTSEAIASVLNDLGDRCIDALADFTAIPGVTLQDLSPHAAQYQSAKSHEGDLGVLSLTYSAEVLISEVAVSVATGGASPLTF